MKTIRYKEGFWNPESETDSFITYTEELKSTKTKKPFPCENLVILPEPVKLLFPDRPSKEYEAGALICTRRVKYTLSGRCRLNSSLRARGERLVFQCKNAGLEFEVTIAQLNQES